MTGRVFVREDGEQIYLPGARRPVDLRAALRVWDEGLCTQTDPEVFFPELGQNASVPLAVCGRCPVRVLCAATFCPVVDHGVVGGLTERQRRGTRRSSGTGVAA